MPYFERPEGAEHRAWRIEIAGAEVREFHGMRGRLAEGPIQRYPTAQSARAAYETAVQEKLAQGFVRLEEVPPPKPGLRNNPELEAAILDAPDDPGAWARYAEWLTAQGDPRGEATTLWLQAQMKDPNADQAPLKEAWRWAVVKGRWEALGAYGSVQAMFERHRRLLQPKLIWWGGFLYGAHLQFISAYDVLQAPDTEGIVRAFFAAPAASLLAELAVGLPADTDDYGPTVDLLCELGPHPGVRTLHIGAFEYPTETRISWTTVGRIDPLLTAFPRLEQLHVTGGGIELEPVKSETLRRLKLETGGMTRSVLPALTASTLPDLQDLELWLGTPSYGGEVDEAQVAALLTEASLPALRRLALMNAELTDAMIPLLAKSPLLAQLEALDLSLGTLTDAGARQLLSLADRFKHLRIDLSENHILDAVPELHAVFGERLYLGEQKGASPAEWGGWAFVSVGE